VRGEAGVLARRAAQPHFALYAILSLSMALAVLVGALFGSMRRLASAPQTPWTVYLAAGLVAIALHLIVNGGRSILVEAYRAQAIAAAARSATAPAARALTPLPAPHSSFAESIPWAVAPFVLTIGICWLARRREWTAPEGIARETSIAPLWEPFCDGLALAGLLWLACALAVALFNAFDLDLPNAPGLLSDRPWMPLPTSWPLTLLGFVIGVLVVREVRREAHAEIIVRTEPQPDKPQPE
jgi:hypothetical protein